MDRKVLILVRMTMTGPGPRTLGSRGQPTLRNRFRSYRVRLIINLFILKIIFLRHCTNNCALVDTVFVGTDFDIIFAGHHYPVQKTA